MCDCELSEYSKFVAAANSSAIISYSSFACMEVYLVRVVEKAYELEAKDLQVVKVISARTKFIHGIR